ncbi:MAG: PucR family transcriptional regulator [Hyphomicrobiales bacterium]|nr:MAG: PucR family transcriptional regulator [Hyphomicrobiales bacterium]
MDHVSKGLAALADRLESDLPEARRRMHMRITEEVPQYFIADPTIMSAGYDSMEAILREVASAVRDPSVTSSSLPPRTIEETVLAARQGLLWEHLEDAYRIGSTELWDWMMDTVGDLGIDRATQLIVLRSASRAMFRWFDETARTARTVFAEEKTRMARTVSRRRMDLVRELVAGRQVREDQLGHPLHRWHLAMAIWRPGGIIAPSELSESASRDAVLVTVGDNGIAYAFVAMQTPSAPSWLRAMEGVPLSADMRVATGAVHHGADGFIRSYQEASATYALMLRKLDGERRQVIRYEEVDIEILLLHDEPAAVRMAELTLGGLLANTAQARTARLTVAEYFAHGCSTGAAARALMVSERTVRNRLFTAERLLGSPMQDRVLRVGLALRIHQALTNRESRGDEIVLPSS